MLNDDIIKTNKKYWNGHADLWFGTTALLPISFCIKARKL